jgi:hypothetical protein
MTEDFKERTAQTQIFLFSYIHGRFDGKKQKEEDVERQVLAGQSNESWRDRAFFLQTLHHCRNF